MSNPFNLHDENSYLGKFIAIPMVLCLACCGFGVNVKEGCRRYDAKKGFERGDPQSSTSSSTTQGHRVFARRCERSL